MNKTILKAFLALLLTSISLNAENLILKRDMRMACDVFNSFNINNVVWNDIQKETLIRGFEKEILSYQLGESDYSLNQDEMIYAQQKMNLYLVSLKSLGFWEAIYFSKEISNEEKEILVSLYTSAVLFTTPAEFVSNVRNVLDSFNKLGGTKIGNYTKFRSIVSGSEFISRILKYKGNGNIKSSDFQSFIEKVVLGDHEGALEILTNKEKIFIKSYLKLNQECKKVQL